MEAHLTRRGFLPAEDPHGRFGDSSAFAALDSSAMTSPASSTIEASGSSPAGDASPRCPTATPGPDAPALLCAPRVPGLGLRQPGRRGAGDAAPPQPRGPALRVCARLRRPPILSYDGYALYNWKRFDPAGPIALGNIDTMQNFVHLYDEHWFILVHVEIEALAAGCCRPSLGSRRPSSRGDRSASMARWRGSPGRSGPRSRVLGRIPEKMDPALYYRTFRPYIRFFEGVVYEGVDAAPLDFRGETGAQSSVVPTLVAFLKIPHRRRG